MLDPEKFEMKNPNLKIRAFVTNWEFNQQNKKNYKVVQTGLIDYYGMLYTSYDSLLVVEPEMENEDRSLFKRNVIGEVANKCKRFHFVFAGN